MEEVNSKATRQQTMQKSAASSAQVSFRQDLEVLDRPIGRQWPESVADVEADVVALLVDHEVGRARGGLGQLPAFGRRHDLVVGAEHHEQRAFDAVRAIRKT